MAREFVTKGPRFYCVSLQPDICKTPIGPTTWPIPYNIKGEFADATGVSANITSRDELVVIHASTVIPSVTGDEQGKAKGVKSGTVGKRVQHDQKSSTVSFNGERAIRVGDTVFMNDKNTVGKVFERGRSNLCTSAKTTAEPADSAAAKKPARAEDRTPVNGGAPVFERLMALVTNPSSVIAELPDKLIAKSLNEWQGEQLGNLGKISSGTLNLIKSGNVKGIAHDLLADGAKKRILPQSPEVFGTLRSASAFISAELLRRVPGASGVVNSAGTAANTPSKASLPVQTLSEQSTPSRLEIPSHSQTALRGAGTNPINKVSGPHGGSDGGSSRGRGAIPAVRSGDTNLHDAAADGNTDQRKRINVQHQFRNFPAWGTKILVDNQVKVYLVKDNVVEAFPWLHNRHPTGHPVDSTYDRISGVYLDTVNAVAVAESEKYQSNSYNTAYHELAHPVDLFGGFSKSENFVRAWGNDYAAFSSDYFKHRSTGHRETFAEGFSRYFGGDEKMEDEWPHLHGYFKNLDKCMASGNGDC